MKLLLDIPDNKASSFIKILKEIPYVKAKPITEPKAVLKQEIKAAADEMNLIIEGKK